MTFNITGPAILAAAKAAAQPEVDSVEYWDAVPGFWEACERVEPWLEARPDKLHNPSSIARGAKVDRVLIYRVLDYLDRHRVIAADGNGCWRKYCAKRR
jgi:hypothetical protein